MITDECDGSLQPNHECEETPDNLRVIDSFCTKLFRPIGRSSTALSVWLSVLPCVASFFKNQPVLSVGVGHGAVAAAALYLRASHVYGVDLRSSFPTIVQREATYIPPEVRNTGMSFHFSWSRLVAEVGGDFYMTSKSLSGAEESSAWIVDIEGDESRILELISLIPPRIALVLRLICCNDWAQYVADAISADFVFNTSAIRTTHKQSFILVSKRTPIVNLNANYHRRTIITSPRFVSLSHRSTGYSVLVFNDWLRKYGREIKVLSKTSLLHESEAILSQSYNCNSVLLREQLTEASETLAETVYAYDHCYEWTEDHILRLRVMSRRLLSVWLANTAYKLEPLADALLVTT